MKKTALVLSHIPPFPAIGGDHLRICQGIDFLTRHFDVDVAYITHHRHATAQRQFNDAIRNEFGFYVSPVMRVAQIGRTLYNGRAKIVNHYDNAAMRRFVTSHAKDYDIVFCASTVMAQYIMDVDGIRSYIDMTDSLAMNREAAAGMARGIRHYLLKEEARRLAAFEAQALGRFRHAAYISEIDKSHIKGGNKFIISNSVAAVAEEMCCSHTPSSRSLLFVGVMDYEPNVIAARFFSGEVMPLIHNNFPDATFTIAGKSPSPSVKKLSGLRGVTVTGEVDSLSPLYRECAVVVAPMLSGSGIQNKILHAMAGGCCVVTTPKGLEGMERLGDALVVSRPDAVSMAADICRLLKSPDHRKRIGQLARQRVMEEFGPEHVEKQYMRFFDLTEA